MVAAPGPIADEGEPADEEAEDQPGAVRTDQAAGDERRPRRRGRRGGRRRRGGPEDGLAGSIADELGPTSVPEATSAVADFDGVPPEPSLPVIQPESIAPAVEVQHADRDPQEAAPAYAQEETAQEAERAARRRSTVREKVSFLADTQPDAAAPVNRSQPEPSAPAPAESSSSATDDTEPRRAGWWSRRFGNGE
jgi:ribonuclease E